MRVYNWTNGKKEVRTFKEISNKAQGIFSANETIQMFKTDNISKHQSEIYDTRFEEVK